MKEIIPDNLLKLLYQVEYLIASEKESFDKFFKEYKELKKVYQQVNKQGISSKK